MTNTVPAHLLARQRAISRHPSTQEANMNQGFRSPIGSSDAILALLQRTPDRTWTNKELSQESGFSDTQTQTALLNLRRKGLPITGDNGVYKWDTDWKPTKIQLQRMVALYELMLSNAGKNGDSVVPTFRGSYQRVLTPRAKQYFRVRGGFSINALSTAYRHLIHTGAVEIRNGRSFEKFLVKHPLDIFDNPGGIRRYDKSVRAPKTVEVDATDASTGKAETSYSQPRNTFWAYDPSKGEIEAVENPVKARSARVAALVDRWHSLTESERGFHSVIGTSLNGHTLVRDADGQVYELRPV